MNRPEHKLQCAILELWRLTSRPGLLMFAVPNGDLRSPRVAARLKAEGVMPGVADLCVILGAGRTGWIEVKASKGRLTDEQKGFGQTVMKRDHYWACVRSVEEASLVLTMWGALRGCNFLNEQSE